MGFVGFLKNPLGFVGFLKNPLGFVGFLSLLEDARSTAAMIKSLVLRD